MEQFIIILGPFDSADAANEYAERWLSDGNDWWIVRLQKPVESSDE